MTLIKCNTEYLFKIQPKLKTTLGKSCRPLKNEIEKLNIELDIEYIEPKSNLPVFEIENLFKTKGGKGNFNHAAVDALILEDKIYMLEAKEISRLIHTRKIDDKNDYRLNSIGESRTLIGHLKCVSKKAHDSIEKLKKLEIKNLDLKEQQVYLFLDFYSFCKANNLPHIKVIEIIHVKVKNLIKALEINNLGYKIVYSLEPFENAIKEESILENMF